MVQLEKTWTNRTAIPSISPFITVVLIPTAGHMERANRKMGFSVKMPLNNNCVFVFLLTGNLFLPYWLSCLVVDWLSCIFVTCFARLSNLTTQPLNHSTILKKPPGSFEPQSLHPIFPRGKRIFLSCLLRRRLPIGWRWWRQ